MRIPKGKKVKWITKDDQAFPLKPKGISDESNASIEGKPLEEDPNKSIETEIDRLFGTTKRNKDVFGLKIKTPDTLKSNEVLAKENGITVEQVIEAQRNLDEKFLKDNWKAIEGYVKLESRYIEVEKGFQKAKDQEIAENNAYQERNLLTSKTKKDLGRKFFMRDGDEKAGLLLALGAKEYGSIWCPYCFKGDGGKCIKCDGSGKVSLSKLEKDEPKKYQAIMNTLDEFKKGGYKDKDGNILKTKKEVEDYFKNKVDISGTYMAKNKDVIMTTGLLSKKWQKGQFGKKHFMVYDKELQQYIEKFPPEQQAEIKKFAIAYRVGKEEYENKEIGKNKELQERAKRGELTEIKPTKTILELVQRGFEIQKRNEDNRRLRDIEQNKKPFPPRLVQSEEQFKKEIEDFANPDAFGLGDPSGRIVGWNSWTEDKRRSWINNILLPNTNADDNDKRRSEIDRKLQELASKHLSFDSQKQLDKNEEDIQKLEEEKANLVTPMMDDKISRYTRLGLLEKLAGAGLKDKNGNKLTTKEDIINEMVKLKIKVEKPPTSETSIPERYRDLVKPKVGGDNTNRIYEVMKEWWSVGDNKVAGEKELPYFEQGFLQGSPEFKEALSKYPKITLREASEKGLMGRMVLNQGEKLKQTEEEKSNLSSLAKTQKYFDLNEIKKEISFIEGQLKSGNINSEEAMFEYEQNPILNVLRKKHISLFEDLPSEIPEEDKRKPHKFMKKKPRITTPILGVLERVLNNIRKEQKVTPEFKETYTPKTRKTQKQDKIKDEKINRWKKENKTYSEIKQLVAELDYNDDIENLDKKASSEGVGLKWVGIKPTSIQKFFRPDIDISNSIIGKNFMMGKSKNDFDVVNGKKVYKTWFGYSKNGEEPQIKTVMKTGQFTDKMLLSLKKWIDDHNPQVDKNGNVETRTRKEYVKGRGGQKITPYSAGALNMDDLFQQMLYGYTFDMRKFKNFQRLARLKTRSKNQTYNLKKKVEEFKERQKQGVADAMEKALQDHKNGIGVNITIKIGNKKLVPNATKGEEGYWTDNEIKSVAKKYADTHVDDNYTNEDDVIYGENK